MATFLGAADRAAAVTLPVLLDAAAKAALLFALAWLLARACRRRSAAIRHGIWSAALVGALFLPALGPLLPGWHLPAPAAPSTPSPEEIPVTTVPPSAPTPRLAALPTPEAPAATSVVPDPVPAGLPDAGAPTAPNPPAARVSPRAWAWLVWLAGMVAALLPVAAGWFSLAALRRRCRRVSDGPAHELLRRLSAAAGLRRPPDLLQTSCRAVPMTWGVLRAAVLLPAGADAWPPERLRAVLLHELAHVRRRDCLLHLLGQASRAVYWFNPLAWLACSRLQAEQERACDDRVLAAGLSAPDYAEHLLAVTANAPAAPLARAVAPAMRRFRQVEQRLRGILDPAPDRRPLARRGLLAVAAATACLVLPLASARWQPRAEADPPAADQGAKPGEAPADKKLDEVRSKLVEQYVKPPNEKQLNEGAIRGMLEALHDPYSAYLSADERAALEKQVQGRLVGIGAQLGMKDGQITVVTPLKGSPAWKAGIRAGDVITAIDGKPAAGLSLEKAVKQIVGAAGSMVKLTVRHPDGKDAEVSITRAPIRIETVLGFRRDAEGDSQWMLDPEHKVGYLRVAQFASGTAGQVKEIIQKLQADGMKGLILDLRFCPGGLLREALEACRLFLPRGTILSIKTRKGDAQTYESDGKAALGDFPLVVLLNGQTASAAEIVAGALGANDRAVLVGSRSFGKGSVQTLVPLGEGDGMLRLTTAYYQLAGGRDIQRRPGEKSWGVDPTDGDYVPLTAAQAEALLRDQRAREVVGPEAGGKPVAGGALTPQAIEQQHADPQLAAALRGMLARIESGKFITVGKPRAAMVADLARQEDVLKRRDDLRKQLEQLDRELLGTGAAGVPPSPPKP